MLSSIPHLVTVFGNHWNDYIKYDGGKLELTNGHIWRNVSGYWKLTNCGDKYTILSVVYP